MKFKPTVFLTAVVVAMGLLLGAATPASAQNYNYTNVIEDLLPEGCIGSITDIMFTNPAIQE